MSKKRFKQGMIIVGILALLGLILIVRGADNAEDAKVQKQVDALEERVTILEEAPTPEVVINEIHPIQFPVEELIAPPTEATLPVADDWATGTKGVEVGVAVFSEIETPAPVVEDWTESPTLICLREGDSEDQRIWFDLRY